MKRTTKLLIVLLTLGLIYSFYRAFTGPGGSGLYDFFDALALTSVILFISSSVILCINYRNLKNQIDTILFLLLGLPLTFILAKDSIESIHYNRTPDLSVKYSRPISKEEYMFDSTNIKIQIDSLISRKNRDYGGANILYTVIDTIIYSQDGSQVFISYATKFEPNNSGNDLDPAYLSATSKNNNFWNLEEGPPKAPNMSGSFHDMKSLKIAVRRYYFNQYLFAEKDSLKEQYFWIRERKNNR
jgi:hypothetical protein